MFFFFFNDTATTEIYTLSLHDALPICAGPVAVIGAQRSVGAVGQEEFFGVQAEVEGDRKSTRLNSSHDQISYAVFCLKKKKKEERANVQQFVAPSTNTCFDYNIVPREC